MAEFTILSNEEAERVSEGQPFHLRFLAAFAAKVSNVDGVLLGVIFPIWSFPGVWPTKELRKASSGMTCPLCQGFLARGTIAQEGWKYQVAQLDGERWISKVGAYGMKLYWGRMAALLLRLCYVLFPHVDWGFVFVSSFPDVVPSARMSP